MLNKVLQYISGNISGVYSQSFFEYGKYLFIHPFKADVIRMGEVTGTIESVCSLKEALSVDEPDIFVSAFSRLIEGVEDDGAA